MSASAWMTTETQLSLVVEHGDAVPVDAVLGYDSADPFAVSVTFRVSAEEQVRWVFARELLMAGLDNPTGQGDVMVWPDAIDSDVIILSLTTPQGHALFEAPRWIVRDFVEQSLATVPAGTEGEYLDWDGTLSTLLAT